jgi:hypothetical protein
MEYFAGGFVFMLFVVLADHESRRRRRNRSRC